MNKIEILATITRAIEIKFAPSGIAIGNFGIAYNDKYKNASGEYVEKAHFFEVTAFGKTCDTISQFFHKGSRILIEGSLDYQSWTDNNGNKRSKVSIKLNGFDFIDRKSDNATTQVKGREVPVEVKNSPLPEVDSIESIPF